MAPSFVVSRTIILLSVGVTIAQSCSASSDSCSTSATSSSSSVSTKSSTSSQGKPNLTCCATHNKNAKHHLNNHPSVTKAMHQCHTSQTPQGCVYTSQASTAYQGCVPLVEPHVSHYTSVPQQAIYPRPEFCKYQTPTVQTAYYQMPPQPALAIVAQHRPLIPLIPQTSGTNSHSHDWSCCGDSFKGLSVHRRGGSRRPVEYEYDDSLLISPLLKAKRSSKHRNEGRTMTKETKKTVTIDKSGNVRKTVVKIEENRPPKDEFTLNLYRQRKAYEKRGRDHKNCCH